MSKISAYVISWDGMHERSYDIARKIHSQVDELFVIYSNKTGKIERGFGEWVRVDDSYFFGLKFKKCLDIHNEENQFLLIHADADCDNWTSLIHRGVSLDIISNRIGLWGPEIYDTSWVTDEVQILTDSNGKISFVAQTDGIVLLFHPDVVRRLSNLDYSNNHFGWGIDWVAICFSYVNNYLIIRDLSVSVTHEKGSGYSRDDAMDQMKKFINQMTIPERVMYKLLNDKIYFNRALKVKS